MSDSPWFPFFASDFLAGTSCMEPDEVGVYVRLMAIQWDKGQIPTDDRALARACGCFPDELDRYRQLIADKFPGGRNPRLEHERQKKEIRAAAGREGGMRKAANNQEASKTPSKSLANGLANAKQTPSKPSSKKLAPQPQPQEEYTHGPREEIADDWPGIDAIQAVAKNQCPPIPPDIARDYWEARLSTGWRRNGSEIVNWHTDLIRFARNYDTSRNGSKKPAGPKGPDTTSEYGF